MDIVKAFADAGLERGVTINIQGTPEDPLFQANQIGALLGLVNVRDAIKEFDDDEKGVGSTDTLGGQQNIMFLTELGLYRLLGMSRKPFARPFQKWVAKVVKEIRLTGKYEMEQRLTLAAEEHQLALDAAKLQLEDRDALVAARNTELAKIRTKIYEELPRLDHVYINKEAAELASDAHKIGKTVDTKKRESQLNTGSAQGSRMIYKRATVNAKIIEDIVKVVQRRYHIASLGGVEHYNNTVEHSVDVIDIAATVVDTLASSYEYMSRRDLLDKVYVNLKALEEEEDEDAVVMVATRRMIKTGAQTDCMTLEEAYESYCTYCTGEKKTAEKKSDFKAELLAKLGEFSSPSGLMNNYWRGWCMKAGE
jgi:prophage antirepressor-like protein